MGKFYLGILLVSLVWLGGCDFEDFAGSSAAYKEDFHHTYALKPGGRLTVDNFNGSVEITGWSQDSVQIDGTKYAHTPELRDAIKIDISTSDNSINIRTIRPSIQGNMGAKYIIKVPRRIDLDRIVSSNGAIRVDDVEGPVRLRTSNGSVRTEKLRGSLEVQTSNGAVEVQDLEGDAVLKTSNGRVRADDVRGAFAATTSNGSIHAHLAKAEGRRPVRLETSNGSVDLTLDAANDNDVHASTSNGGLTVRLPASMGARVRAHTSNASISTDFDVRREGQNNKHHLEGVIGSGGAVVDLSSSNGSIRLLKL